MQDEEEKMVVEETIAGTTNNQLEELFRLSDITDTIQACNFNKGLGPHKLTAKTCTKTSWQQLS
jgi:hypothetical protein